MGQRGPRLQRRAAVLTRTHRPGAPLPRTDHKRNASSADVSVKYRISSACAGSGNPRSCASSFSENTSPVATGVPPPKSKPRQGNIYPHGRSRAAKPGQPAISLPGRDANRCFYAGWCRESQKAARSAEVLALDVEDLDLANRQAYSELERSQIS